MWSQCSTAQNKYVETLGPVGRAGGGYLSSKAQGYAAGKLGSKAHVNLNPETKASFPTLYNEMFINPWLSRAEYIPGQVLMPGRPHIAG